MAKDLIPVQRVPARQQKGYDYDEAWIEACGDIELLRKHAKIMSQHIRQLDHVDQHNRNVNANLRDALERLRDPQIVIDYLQRHGYTVTPPALQVLESKRNYSKKSRGQS